jgi:tripartite-type tricarboxylate transporter receptor subunit TctC
MKRAKSVMLIVVVVTLFFFAFWNGPASGQEKKYPTKPIEMIIPMAPGGPTDVWTRIVVSELTKELGTSIQIQYKPGAGGIIGASFVSSQKPDGYVLLAGTISSLVSAPFFEKEAAYDVHKDFAPIAACVVAPNVLLSHTSTNLTSLDVVLKLAREKPGTLTSSTAGVGTTAHLVIEVLKMYGVVITPVPAKGGAPAATSLLGKHVDLASVMYNAGAPYVKSGDMRILAATDKIGQEPGVPTYKEKGFPECAGLGSWQGFLGPANLPRPIVEQVSNATRKVIQMPSVKKALEDAGFTVEHIGPDDLKQKIAADYVSIDKIVKAAGLGKYAK